MLLAPRESRDFDLTKSSQRVDDVLDQHLGRGGAGRDADRLRTLDPLGCKLAAVGDEIARNAGLRADFAQPIGIGTILGANYQDHIDVMAQFPHRRLAILRGVADVSDLRSNDVSVAAFKRGNDAAGVVDAERRLRHIGNGRVRRNVQRRDVRLALDQDHWTVELPERALALRMAGVADENEHATLGDVALTLVVHLRDQRAGRIEHGQLTSGRLVHYALGNAVGAEDGYGALRHLR